MDEKTFIALFNENKENYDTKKSNLEKALTRNETEFEARKAELIGQFAKFKVGDTVNRVTEKFKVPRKYIITKVWGDVNYHYEYERDKDGKVVNYFGKHWKVYYADIRYSLETANGYKPNGGWMVKEEELKTIE